MRIEEVLDFKAKVLTPRQRQHYFEYGYVRVENL